MIKSLPDHLLDNDMAYTFVYCILFQLRSGRFSQFQNGECDILVCTDIASRGLDTIRVCYTDIVLDWYDSVDWWGFVETVCEASAWDEI